MRWSWASSRHETAEPRESSLPLSHKWEWGEIQQTAVICEREREREKLSEGEKEREDWGNVKHGQAQSCSKPL